MSAKPSFFSSANVSSELLPVAFCGAQSLRLKSSWACRLLVCRGLRRRGSSYRPEVRDWAVRHVISLVRVEAAKLNLIREFVGMRVVNTPVLKADNGMLTIPGECVMELFHMPSRSHNRLCDSIPKRGYFCNDLNRAN
jgi:hypothetical protein